MIPGSGPIQEFVVQPIAPAALVEVVIIEDILDDEEDLPPVQEQHAVRVNDIAEFNPLAIIPYVPPAYPFLVKLAEQIPPPVSVLVPVSESVNEQNPKRRLNFDDGSQGCMAAHSVAVPGSAQITSAALKKIAQTNQGHT
jgi:hypothetical protein